MGDIAEIAKEIIAFAKHAGVGFRELIAGIAVLILVWKANDIIKTIGEFLNQRTRILAKIARQNRQTTAKIDEKRKKLLMKRTRSQGRKGGR